MADLVDRLEAEQRIAVDQVVEPLGAQGKAGHDLVALAGFPAAGHYALFQQRNDRVGDDVGVDADVLAVRQVLQRRAGDPAQADLQRRAVLDDAADVARDSLDHALLRGRVHVLLHRRRHGHQAMDVAHMERRIAHRPRHVRIDLGNDQLRLGHRGRNDVDRDAQADVAELVGQRDLDERHVNGNAPDLDQLRHPGDRQRHVIGQALLDCGTDVGADEERAVPEPGGGAALFVVRKGAAGDEVHELQAGWRHAHRLQRRDQRARRGAGSADENVTSAADMADGLFRGGDSVGVRGETRVEVGLAFRLGFRVAPEPILQIKGNAAEEARGGGTLRYGCYLKFLKHFRRPFPSSCRRPPRPQGRLPRGILNIPYVPLCLNALSDGAACPRLLKSTARRPSCGAGA